MKDFIIIGAGILGASTAYHLVKAGANVTVIDREEPGQASDAAAGIICPWLSQRRNKAWYELAKGGAAYYEKLIQQLENEGETKTGYRKVGAVSLHTDRAKLNKMEERVIDRKKHANEIGDIRKLTSLETSALFPPLSNEFESIQISGAARVNGRELVNALINAAKRLGANFINGSAELLHSNNEVTGVRVGNEEYHADKVLVTAGAWAGELLAPLGINLQVKGQKAQIAHLQLDNNSTENWPVVMPPSNQYILAFDNGRIVIGATHEDDMEYNHKVTAGGLHEIFDKAISIAPGLAEGEFIEARVGFRPFTPNFLPIIGEVPNINGLVLANGLGASGLTIGPYLGAQLSKLALGEKLDIDLDLYDVSTAISSY
ncbi:FAD-binding oxidoreductase [Sporosarcina sp. 6E9]|uniref:NAD(P)/FAD-dependent oxidoreductase n=1 Tax=Sporosarcina sp. 6E9 TaxID=2819235 RepID=UPI001B316584|nr:FAD-binding oxidoreductase [Sporosarcina sp. 6E9]